MTRKKDKFKKYDTAKPKLTPLATFMEELGEVSKVIDYGANKYGQDNWKLGTSDDNIDRYMNALLRHAYQSVKEDVDSESELKHLAHLITNALFIMYLKKQTNVK